MFKNINFDHAFTEDQKFKFFKSLSKMGFIVDQNEIEHPGKAFCRFIMFGSENSMQRAYLEFVHVGKGGDPYKKPGLSYGYDGNLQKFHKKTSKKINANYGHKNYEWKSNSEDYLPGWNFMTLKNSPVRNIFTWFTEYEFDPNREKNKYKKIPKHPNSVYGIAGIELILSEKGHVYFEKLLGKKLKEKNVMGDGTLLYIKKGRANKFQTIILKCKSLKKAKSMVKGEVISFDGSEGILIKSNIPKMWNLKVIQA